MAAVASDLADTSALARLHHPAVATALAPRIEAGIVATCGVIEFELVSGRAQLRKPQARDQVRKAEGFQSDPVVQFAGVLTVAIHLKYVNPDHGAFQVQMPAGRVVISPKGARTAATRMRATAKARWMA